MKFRFVLLGLLVCISFGRLVANNTNGKTFFAHRSQADNLARRIVGEEFLLIEGDDCHRLQGVISVASEYTRSFDRNDLGTYFSFNKTPAMLFAGDEAPADIVEKRDVRAEYFGLSSEFNSTVEFKPQVENVIVDVNLHFNLDCCVCGLYFDIGIPINWTRFGMNLEEDRKNAGTTIDLGQGVNNPQSFSTNIIQAYKGKNGGVPIAGLIFEDLKFARINGRQTDTSVADLEFILGYNIFCNDCGHFGINFRVAAPTGTRPKGEFVFEPVVGNGKHIQVGGGISWHYIVWEDNCYEQSFSFWVEAEVHHFVEARQNRTFDLIKNGVGSRYIQLKKFEPDNTFTGTIIPAANVTTLVANVSVSAIGEAIIMFNYQRCGFLFDVGYGIWGRGKEKIKLNKQIKLKGKIIPERLGVAGKIEAVTDDRTKSDATIKTVGSVDGASLADNIYITLSDIDVKSAASPSAVSHKIFVHLSYMWDRCDYSPFVGIGGEAEFSGRKNHALPQWGVWAKFGVAFSAL